MLCFDLCLIEFSVVFVKHDGKKSMMGSFNFASTFQKFAKFIVSVFALSDVLVITLPLSHLLQSPTLDSVNTSNSVKNILTVLENKRNEAESVNKEMDAAIVLTRISSKRQGHKNNHPSNTPEEVMESFHFRHLTPLAMDLSGSQSDEHLEQQLLEIVVKICKVYMGVIGELDAFVLHAEYKQWREHWVTAKKANGAIPQTVLDTGDNCNNDMFHNIHKLLLLLASLPIIVTTAKCSFSSLRRLKTWLCN
ncbi:hypothetical protein PR048_005203 [Dryococelus australis]|uniref:HAT C-terminal dimerisation domain-containing protein n=1 Tax=Dryococelus australis TaxID=614101 RepID=A0ABQ9I7I8_9NEOP|nr:hypothetical protein PR048_005203 [Dryococelus australis]